MNIINLAFNYISNVTSLLLYPKRHKDSAYYKGYLACKERDEKLRKDIFISKYPIGDIFISIGNEWQAMRIVEIIDHKTEKGMLPITRDISTEEEFLDFSILINYSEGVLRLLHRLNPFERYSLISKSDILDKVYIYNKESFDNEPSLDEYIKSYNNHTLITLED
jgi:hypothetical protein